MNYVISKPYAINRAYSLFKKYKSDFSELYISTDAIKVRQITDYMGDKVFPELDDNISGWLFFWILFLLQTGITPVDIFL